MNIGMMLVGGWLIAVVIGIGYALYCIRKAISEQEYNEWYWRCNEKINS